MEGINSTDLLKICNHNVLSESINPEMFVEFVIKNLQGNYVCSCYDGIHTFSASCNERLFMLSAVKACFEFSIDGEQLISSEDQSCDIASEFKNPSVSERRQDDHSCNISVKSEVGNVFNNKGKEQKTIELDLRGKWYKRTSDMFAINNFIYQLLSLHEKSQCMFASHMIKTVVCLCAMQYNKIAIVLKYIEDNWKRNKDIRAFELDLIKMFMSKKHHGNNKDVRTLVYMWFVHEMPSSLKASIMQKVTGKKSTNFHDNLSILSVLGKLVKYSVSCGNDIQSCITTILLEILESHKDIFIKSTMGQAMFWKYLKVLNNFIHTKFCFEKADVPDTVLKACVGVKHFPSLFEMSETNRYFTSMKFWESEDLKDLKKHANTSDSQHPNVVIVREMLILAIKASAVLSSGEEPLKEDGISSIKAVYECVQLWMTKHFDKKQLSMGWIAALFGDQDDKWITALLCLLIIYQNSSHETIKWKTKPCGYVTCEDRLISNVTNSVHSNHDFTSTASIDENLLTTMDTFWKSICPFRLFFQFAKFISFDHLVISDFLMSPETEFLDYFTKYLVYLKNNWDTFLIFFTKQTEYINHHIRSHSKVYISNTSISPDKDSLPSDQEGLVKRQSCSPPTKLIKVDESVISLVSYPDSDESDDKSIGSSSRSTYFNGFEDRIEYNSKEKLYVRTDKSSLSSLKLAQTSMLDSTVTTNSSSIANKIISDENLMMTNDVQDHMYISPSSSSSSVSSDKDLIEGESENESNDISQYNCDNALESMMTMLIRLRLHVERLDNHHLIPYRSDLILNLLSICEDKHENVT